MTARALTLLRPDDVIVVTQPPVAHAGRDSPEALELARGEVARLLQGARSVSEARQALAAVRDIGETLHEDADIRCAILQLREKAGDTLGLMEDWEALFRRCPQNPVIVEFYMRRLVKQGMKDKALAVLEEISPRDAHTPSALLKQAELMGRIGAVEEADALYSGILAQGDHANVRISWIKYLVKRGLYEDAGLLITGSVRRKLAVGNKGADLLQSIDDQRRFFHGFRKPEELRGMDFRIAAMEQAILCYRDRDVARDLPARIGVTLVTGNLGAGGAERQLSGLARQIHRRAADPSSGFDRIEVVVKEHDRPGRSDFFLPDLLNAGIPVHQLNGMTPEAAHRQQPLDDVMAHLLGMLPPQVHYGVVRLAPHLRKSRPDVISLWQDGGCLFGALAALFAGVPRIQLVFRGLPPNIRQHRFKAEYDYLYKALGQVPGVEFASNSRTCAQAYADWLGLPIERFNVLYNAVAPPRIEGDPSDDEVWDAFAAQTADATETIGGIFRLERDKRPLTWVRMAAAYRRERPKARFVIVGNGHLLGEAKALADRLGLTDRLLFAGATKSVGFWYEKMDVKVLLSRFEGLPNVLIEAQHLGRPVVSTPAGGAAECFDEGVTGFALDCAEDPCLDQAGSLIRELVDRSRADPARIAASTRLVTQRFHLDKILTDFEALCRRDPIAQAQG